jgi:hypothetical protein
MAVVALWTPTSEHTLLQAGLSVLRTSDAGTGGTKL